MELFRAFRTLSAPILGTAALVVMIAGVVYAPGFVVDAHAASSQPVQVQSGAAAVLALGH